MTHLHRELAPISDKAWIEIDNEAARTLRNFLAARQVVDFSGPHGWDFAAESLGRLERMPGPVDGVEAGVRIVQPLVELRHTFSMARTDIDDIDRGRPDPDLYLSHGPDTVELFLEKSIGFRVLTPEAAVAFRHHA